MADVGVISVTKVVGDDGVTRWRVQIPSTREWSPFADGVPNDLNSDLVSQLNPAQQTQLMKAVDTPLGHGAADYAASAKKYISDSDDPRVQDLKNTTAEFFGAIETAIDYAVTRG